MQFKRAEEEYYHYEKCFIDCTRLLLLNDKHKSAHLAYLIMNLSSSYTAMLDRVQRYKLTATKTDKLWVLFHSFSLKEGYQLCKGCDAALGLNAQYFLAITIREPVSKTGN